MIIETLKIWAKKRQSTPALETLNGESVDYATLVEQIDKFSQFLCDQRCSSIGLLAENSINWVIADLAAMDAGITCTPFPTFFSDAQLQHIARQAGIDTIIATDTARISQLFPDAILREQIFGTCIYSIPACKSLTRGISKITFTSGTTGQPKGVCLARRSIDAVCESIASTVEFKPAERHLCLTPLSTLLENIAGIYVPLVCGGTSIVAPCREIGLINFSKLDIETLYCALSKSKANTAIMPPVFLSTLVNYLSENSLNAPATLRFLAVGSSFVPEELIYKGRKLGLPVFEGYGLSEACSVVALNNCGADKIGSVGKILPHAKARISKDGELEVSGSVFSHYLGERPRDKSEYIKTGDVAELDDEGFLYIRGRKKNVLVNSFGRNISPEWIEQLLLSKDEIMQAVVFGDGRPTLSAILYAPNSKTATIEKAISSVNEKLPDYAKISHWVSMSEPLSIENDSLSASGKPRRKEILKQHRAKLERNYIEKQKHLTKSNTTEIVNEIL